MEAEKIAQERGKHPSSQMSREEIAALLDDRDRLKARVEELEAALRPFADEADELPDHMPDDRLRLSFAGSGVRAGDFRRAKSLFPTSTRLPEISPSIGRLKKDKADER